MLAAHRIGDAMSVSAAKEAIGFFGEERPQIPGAQGFWLCQVPPGSLVSRLTKVHAVTPSPGMTFKNVF